MAGLPKKKFSSLPYENNLSSSLSNEEGLSSSLPYEVNIRTSSLKEANLCNSTEMRNVIFTYEWKIRNFNALIDRMYEICSPNFSPDPKTESKWKLVLFPKQNYPEGTQLVMRLVKMSGESKSYGIRFKVYVVSNEGTIDKMKLKEKVFRNLYDFDEDIIASHLELIERKVLQNGSLTIRCELDMFFSESQGDDVVQCGSSCERSPGISGDDQFSSVRINMANNCQIEETKIKNSFVREQYNIAEFNGDLKSSSAVQDSLDKLSSDLKDLYMSKEFADIVILSGGIQMYAHKAVLCARSDYFKTLCSGKGNNDNTINMPDIKSVIMEGVLYYLYTGKMSDLTYDLALDMLSVAKKLRLPHLQQLLADFLKISVTVENVTEILQISSELNHDDLKQACINFIKAHHSAVVRSYKWQLMIRSNPRMAGEILLVVSPSQNHNAF